ISISRTWRSEATTDGLDVLYAGIHFLDAGRSAASSRRLTDSISWGIVACVLENHEAVATGALNEAPHAAAAEADGEDLGEEFDDADDDDDEEPDVDDLLDEDSQAPGLVPETRAPDLLAGRIEI